jgi:sulfate permease, SulP family
MSALEVVNGNLEEAPIGAGDWTLVRDAVDRRLRESVLCRAIRRILCWMLSVVKLRVMSTYSRIEAEYAGTPASPAHPLLHFVPGIRALKEYRVAWLPSDIAAGIALGTVMVPVGLAFGQLAGLPMAGLYTAIFPLLAYAFFGSSRQLVVSPDASMATLVALSVMPLAAGNTTRFALLAGALAVLIGLICILGSVFRLGFMADFLAKQVIAGFMLGLAVIIIVGQLSQALGIHVDARKPIPQLLEIAGKLGQTNLITLAVSVACLFVILTFKRFLPRIPGQIVAIVLAIAAVSLLQLERFGVSVVGQIPSGIPHLQAPLIQARDFWMLAPTALAGAVLAFSDTIVTARAFASRNHYEVDANQELLALGMASITSGLTQGLPLSSSASRTAVAESAGARTQVSSVVAAAVVAAVLLLFTWVLRPLPQAALAGILIAAAYGLCDLGELRRMWQFRGIGFAIAMLTFVSIIAFDVMKGIAIGVLGSIVMLVRAVSFPSDALVGRVPATGEFRHLGTNSPAVPVPHVLIYRFSGPLFFANSSQFRWRVDALLSQAGREINRIIVDCSGILFVDLAGCESLLETAQTLESKQIKLVLAEAHARLLESLHRGGVIGKLGVSSIFATLESAVASDR